MGMSNAIVGRLNMGEFRQPITTSLAQRQRLVKSLLGTAQSTPRAAYTLTHYSP